MNIVKATRKFEHWLGLHLRIFRPDLRFKHDQMAAALFPFFRATFYRWVQVWPEVCAELERVPHILSVGDLHVENFGTWRDSDGRLAWGVNDFDEACLFPYTMDLVRLATSALLAAREDHLTMKPNDAAAAILEGYERVMEEGGLPFVLEEGHAWLRAIAESEQRDPVLFWKRMDENPTAKGKIPERARQAIEHMLPERGMHYRLARRRSGFGSLGRTRLVGIADWKGGRVAREAKSLAPSALHWLDPKRAPAEILYAVILQRAVRCPDPFMQMRGHWLVRRLSPYCSRIELDALGSSRDACRLLEAMGRETGNIHVGTEEERRAILKDLRGRKANWLLGAAQAMADAVEKDWLEWKERWQS
ncbi:MAG: DUF2252 family protein [Terriglobales bacterium]|jgi:hypothetical protein